MALLPESALLPQTMDIAYDHIQEETLPQDPAKSSSDANADPTTTSNHTPKPSLNAEFAEAYKSISETPWGAKLGGFFSTVQKQGSNLYDAAKQEGSAASGEAVKGWQDLKSAMAIRARSLSSGQEDTPLAESEGKEKAVLDKLSEAATAKTAEGVESSESMVTRFRSEATKRLKELEKAEEAADKAILRFGANLGGFLRDAVTITGPEDGKDGKGTVLFESKSEDGKRVIHSTRLEAQLWAIHTSEDKFLVDPDLAGKEGGEERGEEGVWEEWSKGFDVEKRTEEVRRDLERYEELRKMMERLVPEKVEYKMFWCRYYFLRDLVEKEEVRRREVLKGEFPLPVSHTTRNPMLMSHRRRSITRRNHSLGRRLRRRVIYPPESRPAPELRQTC